MSQSHTAGRPLVLLGAGGHAKVVLSLLQAAGWPVMGVCDPALHARDAAQWRGIPVLGGDDQLARLDPAKVWLANGIGQVIGGGARQKVHERCVAQGFHFPALVHPHAWVESTVQLAAGAQVMAGAVVQADAAIGEASLVNTGACVDHDCVVEAHVHIAPGSTLCGGVRIETGAFIGAGATVIPGVVVGRDCVVAAGSTVARPVPARHRVQGSAPAVLPIEEEKI